MTNDGLVEAQGQERDKGMHFTNALGIGHTIAPGRKFIAYLWWRFILVISVDDVTCDWVDQPVHQWTSGPLLSQMSIMFKKCLAKPC